MEMFSLECFAKSIIESFFALFIVCYTLSRGAERI